MFALSNIIKTEPLSHSLFHLHCLARHRNHSQIDYDNEKDNNRKMVVFVAVEAGNGRPCLSEWYYLNWSSFFDQDQG